VAAATKDEFLARFAVKDRGRRGGGFVSG